MWLLDEPHSAWRGEGGFWSVQAPPDSVSTRISGIWWLSVWTQRQLLWGACLSRTLGNIRLLPAVFIRRGICHLEEHKPVLSPKEQEWPDPIGDAEMLVKLSCISPWRDNSEARFGGSGQRRAGTMWLMVLFWHHQKGTYFWQGLSLHSQPFS